VPPGNRGQSFDWWRQFRLRTLPSGQFEQTRDVITGLSRIAKKLQKLTINKKTAVINAQKFHFKP
jgi:hypothetical protein